MFNLRKNSFWGLLVAFSILMNSTAFAGAVRAADPPADPDSPDLEVMAPLMMGAGTEGPFIDFNRARPGADEMMEEGNAAPQATE